MDNWFGVRIKPMLASLSSEPFDSPAHIYEAKWEGVRCLAFLKSGSTRLQSRRLVDITSRYPELTSLPQNLDAESAVVDGVLVVLDKGRPCPTKSLQREGATEAGQAERLAACSPAVLVAFDILCLNGENVMPRPLLERKELLRKTMHPGPQLVLGTWVSEKGTGLLSQVTRAGLSGVVAKDKESPYCPGQRSTSWLKMQRFKMQDCVICGYTEGQGRRTGLLGSLVLGVYFGGELIHIGQVGSGYNDEALRHIHSLVAPRQRSSCPFRGEPRIERPTTWVEPEIVCQVQYAEWTAECKLRAPRYVRLHENKRWEECQMEEVCWGPERELEPVSLRLLG